MVRSPQRCAISAVGLAVTLLAVAAHAEDEGGSKQRGARAASAPQRAGTRAAEESKADVVATEEGDEGVKTYKFGAVEVEGRLRSPQIIYFLRRVRAQFATEGLGHRSFLRELSDTRRHPALR